MSYIKKILLFFCKSLLYLICSVFNKLIPKGRVNLLFIPLPNCRKDKSDLINFTSDNVLSFLNYMLRKNDSFEYFIQVYDESLILRYQQYCFDINPNLKVHFFVSEYFAFEDFCIYKAVKVWLKNFYIFSRCSVIFTSAYWYNFVYKTSSQKTICLNYFIPFKLDVVSTRMKKMFDCSFDFCLTTSLFAAQVDAIASGLNSGKYLPFGFPRNDNLLVNNKKENLKLYLSSFIGYKVSKVVVYTPTYRDYDYLIKEKRNILGFDQNNTQLSELLRNSNAVLLVKLHPLQNMDVYYELNDSNIILLYADGIYGLYDYLSIADLLITDYTSTYFDFLLLNKPVIFNFFDKELYERTRGFSYDPIENICSGSIVNKYEDMLVAMKIALLEGYTCDIKRDMIISLFHKYNDDSSSKRIYDYFFSK